MIAAGPGEGLEGRAREILLAALDPDVRRFSACSRTDWKAIPWDALLDIAERNKVEGIFVGRMDDHGFSRAAPPAVAGRFDEIRKRGADSLGRYTRTLDEVRTEFDKDGIPFLVVKGAVLAGAIYGDPSRRPSFDLDLVVRRDDLERADAILMRIGYEMLRPRGRHLLFAPMSIRRSLRDGGKLDADRAREVYLAHHYHFPLVLPPGDGRLPIDLHWRLSHERVMRAGEDDLWNETTEVGLDFLKTLKPDAALVYLALHGMQQGPESTKLRDMVDLAWALRNLRTGSGSAELDDLAERWGVKCHFRTALSAAFSLFPPAVGEGAEEAAADDGWGGRCLKLAGFDRLYWEESEAATKAGRLSSRLGSLFFWDLALRRFPRSAARVLIAYLLNANPPPRSAKVYAASR